MSRIKIVRSLLKSRAEAEHLVGEIVTLQLTLNDQKIAMDQELAAIRARYEGTLDGLQKSIDEKSTVAMAWAQENPGEFGAKKSIDFVHAVIGFRTGQPKLGKRAGWTWERIKEAVARQLPDYIRTKTEVDREKILADREILAPVLREVGLKVEQDESFFVDPKVANLEQGIVAA